MRKLLIGFFALFSVLAIAQNDMDVVGQYVNALPEESLLSASDVSDWQITDRVYSKQSGLTHFYVQQAHKGILIEGAMANLAVKNSKVLHSNHRFYPSLSRRISSTQSALSAEQAIRSAAAHLELPAAAELVFLRSAERENYYEAKKLSQDIIPVSLMYLPLNDEIVLTWRLSIHMPDGEHWWQLYVDASTGEVLEKRDHIIHCSFDEHPFHNASRTERHDHLHDEAHVPMLPLTPAQYNVFPIPVESPSHGSRSILADPSDSASSPYGWHDVDATPGADFTITRGNNVHAYEDVANTNSPGYSPDGTSALNFDFPYSGSAMPSANQDAAITNLFYMNNIMHDVWYHYGFDEQGGNFQQNNYGRGGLAGDYVFAEAQDGGGTNNANFATPPDGFNPRMQMYLWNTGGSGGNFLDINSPAGIAGSYPATDASFGPGLPSIPITADVVLAIDNAPPVNDGCTPFTNAAAMSGKIALIDRGNCSFVEKVEEAQAAGAVAAIIVNNVPGAPIQMGGFSGTINIPSIMISQADGNSIKAALTNGAVNASISDGGGGSNIKDGDFENGIIAHEYGHGISIRMTGGPSTSGCLNNDEQMGEGWSDWFGLMLTMEPGDSATDIRGIGTYAVGQPNNGTGIRPAPYTTDMSVNGFTYGASNNPGITVPHGVGFIFATALWDLNWALIDMYGGAPDPDVYFGNGGNNIAMHLVMEAFKLQPCSPGMLDGRDAILAADQALYGGIHECLIWNVFANRGFGFSASQGSPGSRFDQVEAFDLPWACQTPTVPPVAQFNTLATSSCDLQFAFEDQSTDVPQSWFWDFGDGNTDTVINPVHTYSQAGSYTVKLVVSNSIGSDSTTQVVNITLPTAPSVTDISACLGDTAIAVANASGEVVWSTVNGTVVSTGDSLVIPNLMGTQSYLVQNDITPPAQFVGPVNNNIGPGGYHGTGFHGALNFTASQACEIKSAWVDADGPGIRTIILASGTGSGATPSGTAIVAQQVVLLNDGPQRVDLNLSVPGPGDYHIGASLNTNQALYRNSNGANYPYDIAGLISITSSSATTAPDDFYYYLYDIEVQEKACLSDPDTLVITPAVSNFNFVLNGGGSVSFQDSSSGASSWFWDFGDGNSSTLQNPVHTYTATGNYVVTLSVNGGLCSSSQSIDVALSTIEERLNEGTHFSIQPNPSSGLTRLVLAKPLDEEAELVVYDVRGREIVRRGLVEGSQEWELNTSNWPAGVYSVRLSADAFDRIHRLIVQ